MANTMIFEGGPRVARSEVCCPSRSEGALIWAMSKSWIAKVGEQNDGPVTPDAQSAVLDIQTVLQVQLSVVIAPCSRFVSL